jgi:S-adenosylmethionine decarboxylase
MKNGKHLIIDAYGCDTESLFDVEVIKEMLFEVTRMIELKPLSDALIYEVDETMIEKSETGVTGGIIFMESHFTFHSFPYKKYFSADIYSCKDFSHNEVADYITKLFKSLKIDVTVLIRGSQL